MNLNNAIVDTAGREIFAFGGETAWKTFCVHGYLVSLEWFVGRKSSEPMMVIQSARGGHDAGALGICLSSIGNYADPSGGAAEGAEARCFLELGNLCRAPLALEARLLLDVILQFTPHLIAMPPAPIDVRRRESAGPLLEVERRANGRTVQQVTI